MKSTPLQMRIPIDELNRIVSEWDALPSRTVSPFRIHDWNSDIRIAHKAGVVTTFSGERNEISCSSLNLSSSQVIFPA